jgi:uncharacterized OsmC-like protein
MILSKYFYLVFRKQLHPKTLYHYNIYYLSSGRVKQKKCARVIDRVAEVNLHVFVW